MLAAMQVPRLPDNAVLVHIGMHKTGTTAVQSMLAAARADLAANGIEYPGSGAAHHHLAAALIGRPSGYPPEVLPASTWQRIAHAAAENPGRTVLSSEFLSRAKPEQVAAFAAELGVERMHVVVGVRHFGEVALSAYQQSLKTGSALTLSEWLTRNFRRDENGRLKGNYWNQQHPVRAVRAWADVVGPANTTVVTVDSSDRDRLPNLFESLLDLPTGELGRRDAGMSNRSMTAAEAELARSVNAALRKQLSNSDYARFIRYGMLRSLVEGRPRGAGEALLTLPPTAIALAVDEGKHAVREISDIGARLIGDPSDLIDVRPAKRGAPSDAGLPLEAAVEAIIGVVAGATRGLWQLPDEAD